MSTSTLSRLLRAWLARAGWLIVALFAVAASARADEDPPGRVGRLAQFDGDVSWYDHEQGQWEPAERNRPLTGGDRVATGAGARAELRVGSTVLRLGSGTELEVMRLDDDRMRLQLHAGSLALRVRTREIAEEIELVTDEVRLHPTRAGHYRIDRIDDITAAGSWRGSLRVADPDGFVVETGQRVDLWREGASRELRHVWGSLPDDAFGDWAVRADEGEERSAATRYVSPEMTGVEDFERHGRWDRHPEYGAVWFPFEVVAGWAPYRYGRWAWVRPWGWTWIDAAPWGFAPFHYGRWVHWHGRWGWWPGEPIARPVFAPALVAWVGGANWGVSLNIGGPAIGWVPLAPYDFYVPWYRTTPVYVDRINRRPPPHRGRKPVPQVPTGPVAYGNQGVPGAVTVVPRDALQRRLPVSRVAVEPPASPPGRPWVAAEPPPAPVVRPGPRPETRPGTRIRPGPEARTEPGMPPGRWTRPGQDTGPGSQTRPGRELRPGSEYRARPEQRPGQDTRTGPETTPGRWTRPGQEPRPLPDPGPAPMVQPAPVTRPAPAVAPAPTPAPAAAPSLQPPPRRIEPTPDRPRERPEADVPRHERFGPDRGARPAERVAPAAPPRNGPPHPSVQAPRIAPSVAAPAPAAPAPVVVRPMPVPRPAPPAPTVRPPQVVTPVPPQVVAPLPPQVVAPAPRQAAPQRPAEAEEGRRRIPEWRRGPHEAQR